MCIWTAADKLDEANVLPVATIPSSVCALAQPSSPGRTLLRADLPSRRPLSPLYSMRALALYLSLSLSILLASSPTRPFSVWLSRSLSGSLSVLLAAARSTELGARSSEHRNAHYRLPFVSGIWHNFLAGRERDKSVYKRHKTAARTDNAAQNRLCSPAARWNGHCLRGCGGGCAKAAGGRHCRMPACLPDKCIQGDIAAHTPLSPLAAAIENRCSTCMYLCGEYSIRATVCNTQERSKRVCTISL